MSRRPSALTWLAQGDRWIPLAFVLFFLAIAAVQAVMIHLALATHTGLVNRATAPPAAIGWQVDVAFEPRAAEPAVLSVVIRDRSGRPVEGARVSAVAERPSRFAQLVRADLQAEGAAYGGMLLLPIGGEWQLTVEAVRGPERAVVTRRLDVPAGER